MYFKHCAIRTLHPMAILLARKGYPLLQVERLFPLFTKRAGLDMNIDSQDYKIPPSLLDKIARLHKDESLESYLDEAKLLFQIIISALAYKDPGILNRVRSIQFIVHTKNKIHMELMFNLTDYIVSLLGHIVTNRTHEDIPINIRNERISLSVFFNTDTDRDNDPWRDLGYGR